MIWQRKRWPMNFNVTSIEDELRHGHAKSMNMRRRDELPTAVSLSSSNLDRTYEKRSRRHLRGYVWNGKEGY
ncbi:hypothetical protein PRIPAC_90365, partial [Pristionchus pacificus]|uniref:Uncharacterized protein n=1 Tax=Pristionchus pacificus TaxID=54126 RepID=A0A2A6CT58_PRIPA